MTGKKYLNEMKDNSLEVSMMKDNSLEVSQ